MSDLIHQLTPAARTKAAEMGMETTPEEMESLAREAFATIREGLREAGFSPPESDDDLLVLIAMIKKEIL